MRQAVGAERNWRSLEQNKIDSCGHAEAKMLSFDSHLAWSPWLDFCNIETIVEIRKFDVDSSQAEGQAAVGLNHEA